jgi:hypothetical protein
VRSVTPQLGLCLDMAISQSEIQSAYAVYACILIHMYQMTIDYISNDPGFDAA